MKISTIVGKYIGRLALLGVAAISLASCSLFAPAQLKVCPKVSLLNEAALVTRYREGPGRDLTDVIYEAKVLDINWSCKFSDGQVRVQAVIDIVAQRGPASTGGNAQVPFFVGIIDAGQNIIAKKNFASEIEFREGRRRAGVREEIEQIVFLKKGEDAADYEIIVGLQLTEQQLKQNRGRRR
jgi:hypothetical protein